MSTAIFIRSYDKDFPWLNYCLRSIQKFATGFCEVIVAVPEGQAKLLKHLTAETVIEVHDGKPGYLAQQMDKLNADLHSGADRILHFDSDSVFTRPVKPETFINGIKPIWVMTPFDKEDEDKKKFWMHVMFKCLRRVPEHEFMRKVAIMAPRELYPAFREHIERVHGMSMETYVMNQPGHDFTEYNCLGFYAWLFHREKLHWHNTTTDGVPDWPFRQFRSWDGLDDATRDYMEELLK